MKKLICLLLVLITLVGCSSKGYSKINDGDSIIFKGPETTFTKNDLYKQLKVSSKTQIKDDILSKIAELENVDMESINTQADEMIELYKSMGYENAIISYYGSLDAYKEEYISSLVLVELTQNYINSNFDRFVENDHPIKMQMASFYELETAQKFIDDVNNGIEFEEAAKNNEYLYDCPVQVYLDTFEAIPLEVKKYCNETSNTGLSTIIECSSASTDTDGNLVENKTYYVLNIVSRKVDEFKDEYLETKTSDVEELEVLNYLFTTHDIKFYDQDIYEIMKSEYEVLQ